MEAKSIEVAYNQGYKDAVEQCVKTIQMYKGDTDEAIQVCFGVGQIIDALGEFEKRGASPESPAPETPRAADEPDRVSQEPSTVKAVYLVNEGRMVAAPSERRQQLEETMDEKPLAGLWRNNSETPEGKYLVKRRDGTVVEWPNFVLGAKDEAAPDALRAYAKRAEELGYNLQFVKDVYALADQFEQYRIVHGTGDPDRGRHRKDDPATIEQMQRGGSA